MARSSVVGIQKTLKASTDLSAEGKQFTFIKSSGNQTVTTAGAGQIPLGVQQNLAKLGKGVMYRITGTSKLVCDGSGTAIAAGDMLKSDASGRGVKASTGDVCGAVALEGCTIANGIIEAQLISPAKA